MMKVLLISLSLLIVSGCASRPTNEQVVAQKQPILEYMNGFVLNECEGQINLDNYDGILKNNHSGFFQNPFDQQECFVISFKIKEDETFKQALIEQTGGGELVNSFLVTSRQSVHHTVTPKKKVLTLLKFHESFGSIKDMKSNWTFSPMITENRSEIMFLHELFHVHISHLDMTLSRSVIESIGDIGSIIAFSNRHKLSNDEMFLLTKGIINARRKESGPSNSVHFNARIFQSFLWSFRENPEPFRSLSSFNDIINTTFRFIDNKQLLVRIPSKYDFYWDIVDQS